MKQDGLYVWEPVMEQAYLSSTKPANKMELSHLRMGHLNLTDLRRLQKLSFGMDFSGKEQLEFCESCCRAKMSSTPFKNEGVKAEKKFQYIYADIVGPFPVKTPEGFEYSLTLIDKFSNQTWVENFATKAEVEEFLEFFVKMIDRQGGSVSNFQFFVSDQGGEFMSNLFKTFLNKRGIQHMIGPEFHNMFPLLKEQIGQ